MKKIIFFAIAAIATIASVLTSCNQESQTTTEAVETIKNSDPSVYGAIDLDASCSNIQNGTDTVTVVGTLQFVPTSMFFTLYFSNGVCAFFDPTNQEQEFIDMKYNSPFFVDKGDTCVIEVDIKNKKVKLIKNVSKELLIDESKR